jgi:very-short-patch-repair endonuclease
VPVAAVVPTELRHRVFRGSTAVRQGLLTPDQLRGRTWRSLFTDVYVHRDVPVTHALRARAAAGVLLPGAVVTGASAAVLWGVELGTADDPVELTVPPGTAQVRVAGTTVRRARLDPARVTRRRGVPVTTPEATAVMLAASLPLEDAVIAVDQLVVSGVVDLEPVRELAGRLTGRGCRRARQVCALADGLAESPQETRLRLLIGRSPLPAPVAQHRVRVGARFVAKVDFGWPERRVAVEYDGLWHAGTRQFTEDRQRLNRIQAAGWRIVFVTAADLHRPEQLIARIAAALAA